MAKRTVALCDGRYIGIETIYTVVNGLQVNIPDKLKELRVKSQSNKLFCPCGCGANLILVAGDKNLREQHFRIKDADAFQNCHMVTEGRTSVDSKIVLKCWLDESLHATDLETRVPVSAISDSSRKYEYSFISRSHKVALNYCHERVNLSDEKLQILDENADGFNIIHVVDCLNGGSDGQYPEGLMKIQNRQGYCLLLTIEGANYDKAELRAVFYEKDIDGFWRENTIADGDLREYSIDGTVTFNGRRLTNLLENERKLYAESLDSERKRREETEKRRADYEKQRQFEEERRREEQKKRQEEVKKRRIEEDEKRRLEEERAAEEKRQREEDFRSNLEELLSQQETQVRDPHGNRWIKCEFCGKVARNSEFTSYGGPIGVHLNLGTCKQCYEHNPTVKEAREEEKQINKIKYDPTICPDCGGKLVERNGRNGRFIGCCNYPRCRYTRSIKK